MAEAVIPSSALPQPAADNNRDQARDAIRKEQVLMEGFLYKKAGTGGGVRAAAAAKAWHKKWCVLRSHALLIYNKSSEDKLKRIIRADEIVDIRPLDRRNHAFVFEIETLHRAFILEASSEQELVTWLARLQEAMDYANTLLLPPGIDNEEDEVDVEDDDEEEVPNFNVQNREEIETRLGKDRVLMRGYLLKQDKLRQWRRRWFVLRQNTLSYYHDSREYEVKHILRPHDIHDIRAPDPSTAKARSLRRVYFKVVTESRNYWLAHNDPPRGREWFNALVSWRERKGQSLDTNALPVPNLHQQVPPSLRLSNSLPTRSAASPLKPAKMGPDGKPLGHRVFSAATSPPPHTVKPDSKGDYIQL